LNFELFSHTDITNKELDEGVGNNKVSVSIDSADSTDEETLGDEDSDDNAGDVDMREDEEDDGFNENDGESFNLDEDEPSRNHG